MSKQHNLTFKINIPSSSSNNNNNHGNDNDNKTFHMLTVPEDAPFRFIPRYISEKCYDDQEYKKEYNAFSLDGHVISIQKEDKTTAGEVFLKYGPEFNLVTLS